MKKLLAIAILTLTVLAMTPRASQGPPPPPPPSCPPKCVKVVEAPSVSILPLEEASATAFAVTVNSASDADEAVVQICYWMNHSNLMGTNYSTTTAKIVLCKECVIPVVQGSAVATDAAPAALAEIQSVRVRLVHDLYERRFAYKETP